MVSFFKNFAKGVLYVLVLPALIVGLAIYAVVALFVFIYLAIKGLILFFTGRSLFEDLPEDKEAKRRLGILPPEPVTEPQETEVHVEASSPLIEEVDEEEEMENNDPFYVPEYLKSQEPEEVPEEQPEEPFIEEKKIPLEPEEPEQIIIEEKVENIENENVFDEKTSQNANIFSISDVDDIDDDDDDNRGSGINIDFD